MPLFTKLLLARMCGHIAKEKQANELIPSSIQEGALLDVHDAAESTGGTAR